MLDRWSRLVVVLGSAEPDGYKERDERDPEEDPGESAGGGELEVRGNPTDDHSRRGGEEKVRENDPSAWCANQVSKISGTASHISSSPLRSWSH